MTLEEEILNKAGTELACEIDKEIIWSMLVGAGWKRVLLPRFDRREHAVELVDWLETNCKNHYQRKGSEVIFEDSSDAVNFILRWK